MKRIHWLRSLFVMLALCGSVDAAVYLPVTDASLVDRSPLAIIGRIEGSSRASDRYTAYEVSVERVLKGSLSNTRISVGVMGTDTFIVPGMPKFSEGQRVILFLAPHEDGNYRIVEMMLGAFKELQVRNSLETRAQRDLTESSAVGASQAEPSRDFAAFAAWIANRAHGDLSTGDYARPAADLVSAPFTLLLSEGVPARFIQFDTGASVSWVMRPGTTTLAAGGATAFQAAIAAYNNEPRGIFKFTYAGTNAGVTAKQNENDGLNTLLVNDPFNDIAGTFSCSSGGVLAVGGYSYIGTHTYKGITHGTINEGDIVMQDGADCAFMTFNETFAAQVLAHELGHVVGFGHSCGDNASPACNTSAALDDALMNAFAHNDNRGARFGTDDILAIVRLYENTNPRPAITINDVSANEGNSGTSTLSFTVSLSFAATSAVTVQYATADSADTYPANSGSDYTAGSGTVSFAVGESSKTINVTITGDTRFEPNETFVVNLSSASGGTISDNQGKGTITNDDSRQQSVYQAFFAVDTLETPYVGDFNGDNKTDIITFTRQNPSAIGDVYVALSTGTSFGANTKWHDFFAISTDETVVIGDYDGDNKDDIATWLGKTSRQVYVAKSTGTGMTTETVWVSSIGSASTDYLASGDANGDGKDDLIMFARTEGKVYVAISDGTKFGTPTVWHPFFAVSTFERPRVADVNGDGKADIVTFATDSPTAYGDVYVAVSNGTSFRDSGGGQNSDKWHDFFAIRQTEEIRVGDINADSKTDFFTFLPAPFAQCYTVLSQGTSMASNVLWPQDIGGLNTDKIFTGDVNGDGRADIIIFAQSEGKVYVSLAAS